MPKATKEVRYTCYAFQYPSGAELWMYINQKYLGEELERYSKGSYRMKRPKSGIGFWNANRDN